MAFVPLEAGPNDKGVAIKVQEVVMFEDGRDGGLTTTALVGIIVLVLLVVAACVIIPVVLFRRRTPRVGS